jgi:hypothetical protein
MEQTNKSFNQLEDLSINNPNFWQNYKQWQENLSNKELDDTDYRESEQEANDYMVDSWGV